MAHSFGKSPKFPIPTTAVDGGFGLAMNSRTIVRCPVDTGLFQWSYVARDKGDPHTHDVFYWNRGTPFKVAERIVRGKIERSDPRGTTVVRTHDNFIEAIQLAARLNFDTFFVDWTPNNGVPVRTLYLMKSNEV